MTVATLNGQPLRAQFPLHVTLFGIEAVVIPAAEYRATVGAARVEPGRKPRNPIEADREVAAFLAAVRTTHSGSEARAECAKRFGQHRTPSRSALDRYLRRVEGRR